MAFSVFWYKIVLVSKSDHSPILLLSGFKCTEFKFVADLDNFKILYFVCD